MITDNELTLWVAERTLTDSAQKIARYDALLDTLVWERTVRKMLETSLAPDKYVSETTPERTIPSRIVREPEIGLPEVPVPEIFR